MLDYHKSYYKQNRVAIDAKNKLYAQAHKRKLKEYKHRWYSENSLRTNLMAKKRYERIKTTDRLAYNLKRLYGLDIAAYKKMVMKQNGVCAICRRKPNLRLSVDHCHTTKVIRGLLCNVCNLALGLLCDDVAVVKRAYAYLRKRRTNA